MKIQFPIKDADYRAAIGVPQSVLKGFSKCPKEVRHLETHKTPPTDSQIIGMIVEPQTFGSEFNFAKIPFENFRTDAAKEWKAEQEAKGLIVPTKTHWNTAENMVRALRQDEDVQKLLTKGRASIGLFCADPATGLMRKGLIDYAPNDLPYIYDLKTAEDASPFGFGRAVASYRYDIQAASYTRLWRDVVNEDRTFVFIVVQNKAPWHTAVYTLYDEQLRAASEQYDLWLARYLECSSKDEWPGFTKGIVKLEVPRYVSIPVEPL